MKKIKTAPVLGVVCACLLALTLAACAGQPTIPTETGSLPSSLSSSEDQSVNTVSPDASATALSPTEQPTAAPTTDTTGASAKTETPTETPVTPTTETPVTPTPTETPVTPTPTETPVTPTTETPVTPTPTETPVTPTPTETPVTPTPTETPVTPTPTETPTPTPTETPPSDKPENVVAEYDISEPGSDVRYYVCLAGGGKYRAVVTGTGRMRQVDNNARPWAEYVDAIVEAYISGGVKNICTRLFNYHSALETVIIEPGVESIGMDAFAYSSSMREIYIPETVNEIGQGILYGSTLETVYLGFDDRDVFKDVASRSNYNFGSMHLPLEYAHYELSFHYGDIPDGLDRSECVPIGSQNKGYQTIFRIKTTEDILFSPEIDVFRSFTETGAFTGNIGDYSARLRIKVKDPGGRTIYTYPILTLPLHKSKGGWYDVFFVGKIGDEEIDCGFCPQPDRIYDVYMEVLDPTGTKVLFNGHYNDITAPSNLPDSKYFKRMEIPGEDEIFYVIKYIAENGGRIEGESEYRLTYGKEAPSVRAVPDEGWVFLQWSDGLTDPQRQDVARRDMTLRAEFILKEALIAVPDVYIVTDSGKPVTHKEYEPATISISGGDGSCVLEPMTTEIRGRGNSSWNGGAAQDQYDSKNSYKIKLSEKQPLFGMSAAKKWVLNSNKFDAPGLRTWSMWKMAELMGTIPYYCESRFVNLYVNGVYRGMYLLSEQIEAKKGRVEIEETNAGGDVGFLIEIDFRGKGDAGAVEDLTYFFVDGYAHPGEGNKRAFVIKNDDHLTAEYTAKVKSFVQACSDAILSGDRARIDALVDIPSLIDMYIIEEFSRDVDVGSASFFIQRTGGGKLVFTAPWDFDFGFGTYGPGVSTKGFYSTGEKGCVWYTYLVREEWFRQAVYDRMIELDREVIPALYRAIEAKGGQIALAGDRNARFWNMYGRQFHGYLSSRGTADVYSYGGYVEFMLSWMRERWAWMEDHILSRELSDE